MGTINTKSGALFFDFRYQGVRCKEYTRLKDTTANRRRARKIMARIEAEMMLGTFNYTAYFPKSKRVAIFEALDAQHRAALSGTPRFSAFAERWCSEKMVEWRLSQRRQIRQILDSYLLPEFGQRDVDSITKGDILAFRTNIAARPGSTSETTISAGWINHIMTPLRMILTEAAERYDFRNPYRGIKSLQVPKTDVHPFTLDEVKRILGGVRRDFYNYYTVRFFTGLRGCEIDALH